MDLLFGFSLLEASFLLIAFSLFVIIICLIVLFFLSRKRAHAEMVLKRLDDLRLGKGVPQQKLEIKKEEFSLKKLLIDKFKPVIEKQLKTKVVIKDFNAKENNFLVLVEISGKKLLLVLDSSGKIIDYKKVK